MITTLLACHMVHRHHQRLYRRYSTLILSSLVTEQFTYRIAIPLDIFAQLNLRALSPSRLICVFKFSRTYHLILFVLSLLQCSPTCSPTSKAPCEMRENMYCAKITTFRDWSLITERGALQNGRGGGHVKFYTYKKGGWGRKKL